MTQQTAQISQNNKRIARNTLLLYVRMIVVTLLSLVTVRFTLQQLGETNYGIYNVVGGVVTFLTFVTATISSATQRFLAFELGKGNKKGYNDTFNMLMLLFVVIGLVVFIVLEGLSAPVIYHWLNIPAYRQAAAEVVYHTSSLAFFINIAAMPFLSGILANERMGVYAYVTIADTVLKFLAIGLLIVVPADNLQTYAVAMLLTTLVTNAIYVFYNQQCIATTRLDFHWDRKLCLQLLDYTGWSFFGALSAVLCNQGLTVLMNLFFGVGVNVAKGIADRVNTIVQSFVTNFYMAVSPQIIKTYASGDQNYTIKIAYTSTRLAYYLMLFLTLPALILCEQLLMLWLGETFNADMVTFTRLTLVFSLLLVFETPITFMMRATGNIKTYQIATGCLALFVVPCSYLFYRWGFPAYTAYLCELVIFAVIQFVRVYVMRRFFPTSISDYILEVLKRPLLVTGCVVAFFLGLAYVTANQWIQAFAIEGFFLCLLWLVGLQPNEKNMIVNIVKKKCKIS